MKLSDMSTEEMAVALCRIAAPVERICSDPAFGEMLRGIQENGKKRMTVREAVAAAFGALVPALLDRHREDTYVVLSVLTGKHVEDIKRQRGMDTVQDVMRCVDKDLLSFFKPSA